MARVLLFVFIIWAVNLAYGFAHEAAHALAVKTLGGQVYGIYVNPLGTDAYTSHSYAAGSGLVAVELAGMAATTLLAFFALRSGHACLPVFVSLRTAIYALNYAPDTDIYTVWQVIGNTSLLISIVLVTLNLACSAIAITALLKRAALIEPAPALKRFLHL
jgi:hypothetical protein